MLIQGIMKCGLGNWQDISEQFVKVKTSIECEEHYFSVIMKQGDGISYDVILKKRELYPEDCILDDNKIKEVNLQIE